MKTTNYTFDNTKIQKLLNIPYYLSKKNLLIQIFCGEGKDILQKINHEITELLPHAVLIGTTTDGEIQNDTISVKKTVISISEFEETTIKSALVEQNDSFQNGVLLSQALLQEETQLLILFSDGTTTNGEEFLKGLESVNSEVLIAGGMAGDNGDFVQTFISCGTTLLSSGAVGVSLSSKNLQVTNSYSFNWDPIGVEHTIDKVSTNRVFLIDGVTPVDFYAKYLGIDVANALPATGIEFPLIIEKNGIQIARAVIAKHDDGSLSFAGNLNEGETVRLGFGNAEMILSKQDTLMQNYLEDSVESFFIYSCMARRRYMPDLIQIEIEPFSNLAPTAGFFTYAEFYHHKGHNELLNQTLTAVALCELSSKKTLTNEKKLLHTKKLSQYATTVKALTHLIQQSSKDLEAKSKKLTLEKEFSQKLLAKQKQFLRHAVHETSTPLSVIMSNVDLYELKYGKNEYLSNIDAAMKNVFTIYDDLAYLIKKDQLFYPKHNIDLNDYIRSRIAFFTQLAHQSKLSFEFFSKAEKKIIHFNEMKLQRIIDNNFTNAIKYTKSHETIYVSIEENDTEYTLIISSTSIHIKNAEKIFEAYYRENSTKSDGFGLGLNLVKQICDEENVRIEVHSKRELSSFTYFFSKG